MVAEEGADGLLFEDELHLIRCAGRVVWCQVRIPSNTLPAAGAAAAQQVGRYLIEHVLHRRSPWLGLILDVRQGPSVFGPITRQVSSDLFENAERARKPFAVLTLGDGTQHAQYCALATTNAPRFALVTADAERASDWMMTPH